MSNYALACRACAIGLLNTAREVKRDGHPREVARLVSNSRWYWHRYLWDLIRERN